MAYKKEYQKKAPQQAQTKKSGATYSKISKGNFQGLTIVNAWNVSKQKGLITVTVAPYNKTAIHKTQTGKEYQTMMAKVLYHNSGIEKLIPCTMNVQTKVIGLESIRMCISPNGSGTTSGGKRVKGYFGTYIQR